jgi:hypothetical protein
MNNEKKTSIITIINDEDQAENNNNIAYNSASNNKYLNVSNPNISSNNNNLAGNKTARINLFDKAPSLSFDITFNEPTPEDEAIQPQSTINQNITNQIFLNVQQSSPSKSLSPNTPLIQTPSPVANNATINLNWPVVQNKIDDLNEYVELIFCVCFNRFLNFFFQK